VLDTPIDTIPHLGFSEPIASWLHFGGAILAAFATRHFARRGTTPAARLALAIFGYATVFALAMSGAYHACVPGSDLRAILRRLDHAGIWLLIAGTFTPIHVILFRGRYRWMMLTFIWAAAAVGIVLKTIFFATFPEILGLSLYLGLGWIGAVSGTMVYLRYGWRAVKPMAIGGLLYSLGGTASVIGHPVILRGYVGHHELFHMVVLAALFSHWRFMETLGELGARQLLVRGRARRAPASVPIPVAS
jgi:hemolysin III